MRRSNSPIDLEDKELARQIVRSFHEIPHHLYEGAEAPAVIEGVVPRLLPTTDPRPSCEGEATVVLFFFHGALISVCLFFNRIRASLIPTFINQLPNEASARN